MSVQERAITIGGPQADMPDMLGIVSQPASDQPGSSNGVVIVVGGAQYRVGSHRQFVLLARHFAAHGHPVLRFDFPGMGDSPGECVGFEDTAPHIAAAISAFQATCPSVQRVVLWGLCDGASASLLYIQATQDPRVAGLALLNPWVRCEAGLARAHIKHHYRQRLLEATFWRKLLVGDVGWQALRSLGHNLRVMKRNAIEGTTSFQDRMAQGWRAFPGPILLLLSERDLTAQEFRHTIHGNAAWKRSTSKVLTVQKILLNADHTCSQPSAMLQAQAETWTWLQQTINSAAASHLAAPSVLPRPHS